MYIACPECNTKFVVTPEQIGVQGRKVKCSKCAHIWHQKPENQINVEARINVPLTPTPLGNGVNLPALMPVKIQPYFYVMPILMIGLIIFMLTILFADNLGADSLLNNNDLAIKDIKIENQKDLGKIIVSYKVHNTANKISRMPLIRIRLLDKNHRVIKSLVDDHTKINMSPNQFIEIKTEFVPAPPSTDTVDIMIGNKIDFILR